MPYYFFLYIKKCNKVSYLWNRSNNNNNKDGSMDLP